MERGRIVNRDRAKQLRDFSGLKFGKITPTDIDMSMDFSGQVFIFAETKYKDTELTYGQRKHLEYLVEANKYPAVAYITEHENPPEIDIDMANTVVRAKYTNTLLGGKKKIYKWQKPEDDNILLHDEVRKFTRCHYRYPPLLVKKDLVKKPEIYSIDEEWTSTDMFEEELF